MYIISPYNGELGTYGIFTALLMTAVMFLIGGPFIEREVKPNGYFPMLHLELQSLHYDQITASVISLFFSCAASALLFVQFMSQTTYTEFGIESQSFALCAAKILAALMLPTAILIYVNRFALWVKNLKVAPAMLVSC